MEHTVAIVLLTTVQQISTCLAQTTPAIHVAIVQQDNTLTDVETTPLAPALHVPPPTVATCSTSPGAPLAARDPVRTAPSVVPGLGLVAAPGAVCPTRARAQTVIKENMAAGGDQGRVSIVERGSIIRMKGLRTQTAAAHVVRESTTPTSDHYQWEPVPHATQENTTRILVVTATALA